MKPQRLCLLYAWTLAWAYAVLPPAAWALDPPELELDPYYTALGLTVPFQKGADTTDVEKGEADTYRKLLEQAFVPRFLVLEASVNPLPLTGVLIRKRAERLYEKAQYSPTLNLVEAVTAGFEEPYALSVFLGKVVNFSPSQRILGRAKKGYVGFLVSAGNYHILESRLIHDDWVEAEWKIKGDLETEARKMSWSFRVGGKFHADPDIRDLYYIGLRRNRVDFKETPLSFLLNSAIEYRIDFNSHGYSPIGHYLLLEKNFPIPKKRWTFSLGVGYLWRGGDRYTGSLARGRLGSESQILFRPNLKF